MHFIRQHRIEALFKSGRQARGLFTEIGQRLGLTYDETIHMTYTEIVDSLIASKLSLEYSVISDRMIEYGLVMEKRVVKYITGEELAAAKEALPIKVENSNRLTGETAYNGKCKAKAYVVDDLDNIGGMQQGNILVAPMTSPYHVSAMMIADAVLTNEGGILSHAAIICRELQIPCIVGLKNATTVIKNGDNLSINAESSVGVVEILESPS
jgi:pyruvate,water dikinase